MIENTIEKELFNLLTLDRQIKEYGAAVFNMFVSAQPCLRRTVVYQHNIRTNCEIG